MIHLVNCLLVCSVFLLLVILIVVVPILFLVMYSMIVVLPLGGSVAIISVMSACAFIFSLLESIILVLGLSTWLSLFVVKHCNYQGVVRTDVA